MLNKKNLVSTLEVLKKLKPEQFDMGNHYFLSNGFFVGSIIGHAAMELDSHNLNKNYITPHLVTGEPTIRWRAWAFDFYNIKHEAYDYLFSKEWAKKDNSLTGAINRIELYLKEEKLPKRKTK